MKKTLILSTAVCLFISSIVAAETISVQGIDLDFVTIGNAGNVADSTDYGAVDYTYQIGKYEITNGQWDQFVSFAGAPTGNPNYAYDESATWTGTNLPTNEVSWFEAVQFCNYLTSGDKYSGAYNFDPSGNFLGVDRASAISIYGTTYVIPTEDEWYKAAYYTGSGYSFYANGTDTPPIADSDTNYNQYSTYSGPWDVGTGTEEQNGTFDMMGNVWEWTETAFSTGTIVRGGSYSSDTYYIISSHPSWGSLHGESDGVGIRVASVVPEPASAILLMVGAGLLRFGKRKR